MGTVVTPDNLQPVYDRLMPCEALSVDTETTSLRPFHGGYAFSYILSDGVQAFYFPYEIRFHTDGQKLRELFAKPRLWLLMNATFDMHMLALDGLFLSGKIHDLKVGARLLKNDEFKYSLELIAQRAGMVKSNAVEEWITENGAWEWQDIPGKKTRVKNKHFDRVPLDVIIPYACQDALITFRLGAEQLQQVKDADLVRPPHHPPLAQVLEMESLLTRAVFHVEQLGVRIDRAYCMGAITHETQRLEAAADAWLGATGVHFQDSPAVFAKGLPESAVLTATGRVSYNAEALDGLAAGGNELAKTVLTWRDAKKRLDFYHGFLYHADSHDNLHANFDQAGTVTGRFSSSSPNLQQLTKTGENEAFPVRRAIVPRNGFSFAMLDFQQSEYRLMLDYAGRFVARSPLVDAVLGGADVHQATADAAGIPRWQAKNVNFAILYCAGLDKLAAMIGTHRQEAARIRGAVMDAAPEIRLFIDAATRKAAERGYVVNWFGRKWHLADSRFAYRAPNFLCQGGGADAMKIAWVQAFNMLLDRKAESRIVLQVHDELVLEIRHGEEALVDEVRAIMDNVYPFKLVPQKASVAWSKRSLADKEK